MAGSQANRTIEEGDPSISIPLSVQKYSFGTSNIILFSDLAFILGNEHIREQHKETVDIINQQIRDRTIPITCLTFSLLFSLRRYFPVYFGNMSLGRATIDMIVFSVGMYMTVIMAATNAQVSCLQLKQKLIEERDYQYYQHALRMYKDYGIYVKKQMRQIMKSEQEFQQWAKDMKAIEKQKARSDLVI